MVAIGRVMLIDAGIQLDVTTADHLFEAGEIDLSRPRTNDDHVDQVLLNPGFDVEAIEVTARNRIGDSDRE